MCLDEIELGNAYTKNEVKIQKYEITLMTYQPDRTHPFSSVTVVSCFPPSTPSFIRFRLIDLRLGNLGTVAPTFEHAPNVWFGTAPKTGPVSRYLSFSQSVRLKLPHAPSRGDGLVGAQVPLHPH